MGKHAQSITFAIRFTENGRSLHIFCDVIRSRAPHSYLDTGSLLAAGVVVGLPSPFFFYSLNTNWPQVSARRPIVQVRVMFE